MSNEFRSLFSHPNPGGVRDSVNEVADFCNALQEAYANHPRLEDIRVGQFLSNLLSLNGLPVDSLYGVETVALTAMVRSYPVPLSR